jgi:hypothetical protein
MLASLDRHFVLFTILLFFCVSAFLFAQNERALDPGQYPNFLTISFVSPENPKDTTFSIQNLSNDTLTLTYQIQKTEPVSLILTPHEEKVITPSFSQTEDAFSVIIRSGEVSLTLSR